MVYSNFTARTDKNFQYRDSPYYDGKVTFVGMQAIIQSYLIDTWNKGFFSLPEAEVAKRYQDMCDTALGPGMDISHIIALHRLGYLPVEILALPEGTNVPLNVPMWTIHNTIPEFFWVTNYLETALSALSWKACTSATIAKTYWRLFKAYQEKTGAPEWFVDWQGHDFSARGLDGVDSLSGIGHLVYFLGTDTVNAIDQIRRYYPGTTGVIGGSVPATEHSVMCMGGMETERETFRRLIQDVYPKGIVSIVSDTWDFWNVLDVTAPSLKDIIVARDGKVVFRPDSGDPVKIIVGDMEAEPGSPAWNGAVKTLENHFGSSSNRMGYAELDPHVGLIYGDSITLYRAEGILQGLADNGYASNNSVFGIGSFTYQYNTRDTFGFAMKATAGKIGGKFVELFKDPKTDSGSKRSAKGFLKVVTSEDKQLKLEQGVRPPEIYDGKMRVVFRNGEPINTQTFNEIRNIAKSLV